MKNADCIIVGAGLSGLAAAITLHKAGMTSLIIEADGTVGGRVKTVQTSQGFLTDVGFQVLLNSYPEVQKFVDLSLLKLKTFNSGALVYDGQELELLANPVAHPSSLISAFSVKSMTTKDRALVVKLIIDCQFQRSDFPTGAQSTSTFLKEFGFSENFIELFWRPFLTGVFLDPELETGSLFFKFLMRCFSVGQVSVPENGMAELPLQMAKQLPKDYFLLNQKVKSYGADHVILENGERLSCKKLICAFDPETVKTSAESNDRQVTTHYFTGENLQQTGWGKWLVLVPRKLGMGIDHFCLMSSVSEKYGNGMPLLSASVVGQKEVSVQQAIQELNKIAKRDLKLELVISHIVHKALPKVGQATRGFEIKNDVIFCGDRWTSPSINGALKSGRLAAEFILQP